jgi:hypothetical protein
MIGFNEYYKSVLNEIKDFNFFVAGGSVSALHYNLRVEQDLDLFFRTEEDFNNLKSYFDKHYTIKADTRNACTYQEIEETDDLSGFPSAVKANSEYKIQLIKRNFGTPEEIISNFDINKTMIALDIKHKKLVYDPRFWEPLHIITYNIDTLKRIAKYSERICESVDWYSLITKFLENFDIESYYTNTTSKSINVLSMFLKNYMVTSYSNKIVNDISEALEKFDKTPEMMKFLECVFIPYNTNTDIYILQILYYKYFSTLNIDNQSWKKDIQKLLHKYSKEIKIKNPELLFL